MPSEDSSRFGGSGGSNHWAAIAIVIAVIAGLMVAGFILADIPFAYEVCSIPDVAPEQCEPARLGRMLFGAVLAGGGLVSAAVITAAFVVRRPPR